MYRIIQLQCKDSNLPSGSSLPVWFSTNQATKGEACPNQKIHSFQIYIGHKLQLEIQTYQVLTHPTRTSYISQMATVEGLGGEGIQHITFVGGGGRVCTKFVGVIQHLWILEAITFEPRMRIGQLNQEPLCWHLPRGTSTQSLPSRKASICWQGYVIQRVGTIISFLGSN